MLDKKNVSIAIIGGGLAGIATAYQLKLKGYKDITIYELQKKLAGLVLTHKTSDGIEIENFYHHIFSSDKYILEMIRKLSLKKDLKFINAKTSHLINNKIYNIGSLKDFFLTKIFSPVSKLRFLIAIAIIKFLPNSKKFFKSLNAVNFSKALFGKSVHQTIWLPLLKKKFNKSYALVPASWLISRIKCRTIKLGYLSGSFSLLINKLVQILYASNIKIKLNTKIQQVSLNKENKVTLSIFNKEISKDIVVFSSPQSTLSKLLEKKYIDLVVDHIEYLSATCVIVYLDEIPFDDYWINYCEDDTKALAIINHAKFLNYKNIKSYPVYIAYYHNKKDPFFSIENKKLLIKDAINTLEKICSIKGINLPFYDPRKINIYTAKDAQPIINPYFNKNLEKIYPPQPIHPNKKLPIFFSNMHCVYPEDRGQNFSLKFAKLTVKEIENYLRNFL